MHWSLPEALISLSLSFELPLEPGASDDGASFAARLRSEPLLSGRSSKPGRGLGPGSKRA